MRNVNQKVQGRSNGKVRRRWRAGAALSASPSRVAHTFRSLECMRHASGVEWRKAPGEALLRPERLELEETGREVGLHAQQSYRPEAGGSAWRLAVVQLEVLFSE